MIVTLSCPHIKRVETIGKTPTVAIMAHWTLIVVIIEAKVLLPWIAAASCGRSSEVACSPQCDAAGCLSRLAAHDVLDRPAPAFARVIPCLADMNVVVLLWTKK